MNTPLHASARALEERGAAYISRGEYVSGTEPLQQSLTEYRMLRDRAGEARTLDQLGKVYRHKPDLDRAHDHHQEALSIYDALGDRKGQGQATDHLGLVFSARRKKSGNNQVSCGNDGPWKAWKAKPRLPTLPTALGNHAKAA